MRKTKQRELKFRSLLVFVMACAVIFILTRRAGAAELSEPFTSVRALGMGNAYTAVVDDSDALFYNPANLANNTAFRWTLFDPRAGINGMDTINNIQNLMPIMSSGSTQALFDAIDTLYGKRIWANGGAKTAILLPNFAMAGFASSDLGFYVQNPAATTMNLNYFFDYGIAVGAGVGLIPGIWKVGFTARRVNRTGTTLPLGPAVLATVDPEALEGEFKRRGNGYGLDLGTTFTIPGPVSPTLSFVYKNVGATTFSHEEGAGAPPRIESEVVIGAAIDIDAAIISITPSIDYKYATREDIQIGKKIHLGLEIDLPLLALRVGLHQGYYTAGAGLDLGPLRFDAATYGVELGEYPGQHEDRRYVAQLTFELGFDPGGFGFGGGSGKSKDGKGGSSSSDAPKRRLKQRR